MLDLFRISPCFSVAGAAQRNASISSCHIFDIGERLISLKGAGAPVTSLWRERQCNLTNRTGNDHTTAKRTSMRIVLRILAMTRPGAPAISHAVCRRPGSCSRHGETNIRTDGGLYLGVERSSDRQVSRSAKYPAAGDYVIGAERFVSRHADHRAVASDSEQFCECAREFTRPAGTGARGGRFFPALKGAGLPYLSHNSLLTL